MNSQINGNASTSERVDVVDGIDKVHAWVGDMDAVSVVPPEPMSAPVPAPAPVLVPVPTSIPFNTGLDSSLPSQPSPQPDSMPEPAAAAAAAAQSVPETVLAPATAPVPTPIPPMLNPLQSTEKAPSSTIVEPPRSPPTVTATSTKRNSPDEPRTEREDEEREIKRVKPDESATPMPPPATPSPAPAPPVEAASSPAVTPAPVELKPTPAPAPAAHPPAPYQQPTTQVVPPAGVQPLVVPRYLPPPPRPAGPTTPLTTTQHKHLINVVRTLKRSKDAVAFLAPVDPIAYNIPHYTQIVTKPMDLGTVETKLVVSNPNGQPKDKSKMKNWDFSKGTYRSVAEVVGDVRQIFENTRMFNGAEHGVSQAATRLEDIFEKALEKIPAEPAGYASSPAAAPSPSEPYASSSQQVRRPSISHPPTIRRNSQGPDASRPKREIHPPPPKDLLYNDGPQGKKKRKSDAQINYCYKAISDLSSKKQYWEAAIPFLKPVDPVALGIPEYTRIIKRPMDMSTIKSKITEGEYDDPSEINDDMKLMFSNCFTFNPPGTPVHSAGMELKRAWEEKWRNLPAKVEPRMDDEYDDMSDDDSDVNETIRVLEGQAVDLQRRIAQLKEKKAQRKANRNARAHPYKQAKAARPSAPKQSRQSNGHSPANGSGRRKQSTGVTYREDDGGEDYESDDDTQQVTLSQKQQLAEMIQSAEADILAKAIKIIQETTSLGSNDDEIELDIDALPPATVLKLYNLVVRGTRKSAGRPKSQAALVPGKKPGRKGTGGLARKSMNEMEEAERIRKMEDQLATFDQPAAAQHDLESDESSEEDSDED